MKDGRRTKAGKSALKFEGNAHCFIWPQKGYLSWIRNKRSDGVQGVTPKSSE